ncbi:hypothetical protein CHS0354_042416 [Potamilus streckersoni]|uniref:Uncharacterized protein n=1 Tax=Potamilus streckersoni TaxID=2493646 RepID=A0AAE0SUP5_9BIVA|nr:hypothetical protein CHS0354_042416 [Potamilus streckersoni]
MNSKDHHITTTILRLPSFLQTTGHEQPSNVEQAADGSLYIIGLTLENTGPYSCQAITACGTYKSAQFWVNIQ